MFHASGARLIPILAFDLRVRGIQEEKVGDTTLSYEVFDAEKKVKVYGVRTPVAKRGQGSARRAMETLLTVTDAAGYDVYLDSSPLDRRTRDARLHGFYESLGFVDTGKKINLLGDPEMVRKSR